MSATSWGRQELTPALRAQRLALVTAARDRLTSGPVRSAEPSHEGTPLTPSIDDSAVPAGATARSGSHPVRRADPIREREAFLVRTNGQLKVREQAEQLGMSAALVSQYRQRLAKQGRMEIRHRLPGDDHRKWTKEEDAYLLEHTGAKSFAEMAAALRRSENAILVRVKRDLGISRRQRKANRGTMNVSDVARILGVDLHAITREGFIPWGQLKAARHPWLRANGGHGPTMQWMVERQDLVDFLVDYPWQYDRTKITDQFFRQVADAAWDRDPLYTTDEAAKILGFNGQHGVSSFLMHTAPKFVSRSKLVLHRKGNPRATRPRSFTGMPCFIPRSTLEAIQRSGWLNYRQVIEDPNWWTAEAAAQRLMADEARPSFVTKSTLVNRIRGFYESGAIPTRVLKLGDRQPWRQATPADVLALKDALFARSSHRLRLTGQLRALIDRHDPSWLQRPRDLALALADGRIETLKHEWRYAELRAAAELRHVQAKKWVFVTRHVRAVLLDLGPKTKYGGPRRRAICHLQQHGAGWVRIPLVEANRRGLRVCGWCEFERQAKTVCSRCRSAYRRGRGRPAREPLCPNCKRDERYAA